MYRSGFLVISFLLTVVAFSQKLTLPDLNRLLYMNAGEMNSWLLERGYRLSYNDSSATGINRYYDTFRGKDSTTQVHSLSYSLARVNGYEGILMLYRTYDKKEQEGFLDYLKANGFVLADSYRSDNAENYIYKKESVTIRNVIAVHELEDKRKITSYSIETGR